MRPERFHPGNVGVRSVVSHLLIYFNEAGAFPPRKCGGRSSWSYGAWTDFNEAGAFPPRKCPELYEQYVQLEEDFNEAGAFPPRKFPRAVFTTRLGPATSMRPERFHPGNRISAVKDRLASLNFNEAGAFPPRK